MKKNKTESFILINGLTIREIRHYCCLTLEAVEKELNEKGFRTSVAVLINWELGYSMPSKQGKSVINAYYVEKQKKMTESLGWQ